MNESESDFTINNLAAESLTNIKGIGPATEKKLNAVGIFNVKDLIDNSEEKLESISGFSEKKIQQIKKSAQDYCKEKNSTPALNNYIADESIKIKHEENSELVLEEQIDAENQQDLNPLPELEIEAELEKVVEVQEPKEKSDSEKDKEKKDDSDQDIEGELLSIQNTITIKKEIVAFLRKKNFEIVKDTYEPLKDFFNLVDIITFKKIKVQLANSDVSLLIIFPIKICNLKGTLIVKEDEIDYSELSKKFKLSAIEREALLRPNLKDIAAIQDVMLFDLCTNKSKNSGGKWLNYFKKYFDFDFKIEKTLSQKKLFFKLKEKDAYSYTKIIIDPIVICNKKPHSEESEILYPYQKRSNLHLISQKMFPELVSFLIDSKKSKYATIEKFIKEKSLIDYHFELYGDLKKKIYFSSVPLIITLASLVIVSIVIISIKPSLSLNSLFFLGIASFVIYAFSVFYFYFQYYKRQLVVIKKFKLPYYLQKKELNEIDLERICEENQTLSNQFFYEVVGVKEIPLIIKEKLEKLKKRDLEVQDYESNKKENEFDEEKEKNELIEKYSKVFEEDDA